MKKRDTRLDKAFTDFVRHYQKAAFSIAYGRLRNIHDAEDITQNVFAEVYRKRHRLSNSRTSAWLFKLIAYRCNDHLRKKIRRKKRELDYTKAAIDDCETQYSANSSDDLFEAIERLPEKYLVPVMLRYFADLSYLEISRITGLTRAKIDHRLREAKRKLREVLNNAREGSDQE